MAYGVDAYGRPLPDTPTDPSQTPTKANNAASGGQNPAAYSGPQSANNGTGGYNPASSGPGGQQSMNNGAGGYNPSQQTRADNTAPQQQGQQPASMNNSNLQGTQPQARSGDLQGGSQTQTTGSQAPVPGQDPGQPSPPPTAAGYGTPQAAIAALYAKHGVQDGGAGSGFTDANYWAGQAQKTGGWNDYWNNRLDSNLSGTGTDAGGNNAPQYQTSQQQQAPTQGNWQQYTPGQLPNQTNAQAGQDAFQYNTGAMPTYQAGQLSQQGLPAYMAAQMAQYQQPGQSEGLNNQMSSMMGQLLANPNSMSDQNVAQLKEQQKEQSLSMQQQMQAQGGQQAASQGMFGGGQQMANDQRSRDTTLNSLLSGYRGIDLQKMTQDRADQLGVLNAGQGLTNSMTNQAQSNYGSTLAGQQAQAGQNLTAQQSQAAQVQYNMQRQMNQEGLNQAQAGSQQNATNYGFQVQQAQNAANQAQQQYALQQAMAQQGLNQTSAQINNQTVAGQMANNLAYAQMQQQNSQFGQSQGQQNNQFMLNYGMNLNH